jgi:hypothetical protein
MKTLEQLKEERFSLLASQVSLDEEAITDEAQHKAEQRKLEAEQKKIVELQHQNRREYDERCRARTKQRRAIDLQLTENQQQKKPAYEAKEGQRREMRSLVEELLSQLQEPLPPAGEELRAMLARPQKGSSSPNE